MFNLEKIFQKDDETYIALNRIICAIILYVSSILAFHLRENTALFIPIEWVEKKFFFETKYFAAANIEILIFFLILLFAKKTKKYQKGILPFIENDFKLITLTFVGMVFTAVILKEAQNFSRIWYFSNFFIAVFFMLIMKLIFDYGYEKLIQSNIIQRNILLVGDSNDCYQIVKKFKKSKDISIIKGLILTDKTENSPYTYNIPIFTFDDDLEKIIRYHVIGQVWIISSFKTFSLIDKIIDDFLHFAVDCRLIAFESKYDYVKEISKSESLDFYDISFSKFYGSNLLLKTILDKFLSIIILILISPILLICSLFIVLEDGFPILFSQKRTGWDAREFYMYKLRSLYKDNLNQEKQVAAGDIRVTRVGKIMRRLSIDELPQFFNVLKGDMSIVGPRPHMIEHSSFYSKQIRNFFQRHKSSPGITGWAQVKGLRGPTATNELMKKRVEADLWYLKNWSIWLDLIIIIKTLFVVLRHKVD